MKQYVAASLALSALVATPAMAYVQQGTTKTEVISVPDTATKVPVTTYQTQTTTTYTTSTYAKTNDWQLVSSTDLPGPSIAVPMGKVTASEASRHSVFASGFGFGSKPVKEEGGQFRRMLKADSAVASSAKHAPKGQGGSISDGSGQDSALADALGTWKHGADTLTVERVGNSRKVTVSVSLQGLPALLSHATPFSPTMTLSDLEPSPVLTFTSSTSLRVTLRDKHWDFQR